uniref:Uncharacterized protein n=1 Tax=Grammatophora oceanica TaxID=210454 RepID=A0A7S1V824_9STRA|mmetsp:Transcript_3924/g.5393  ORF Transcript_3924/g.5393 Transcript_3924/m.5393 type:complete len:101 (+) Transcript_3924:15-317(+)|eukprot:CAMPEP_0194035646 /NCGR_PEP_ID=MMETSP0009_2-20130614/8056_1 /TAXON_ID=210454 /ORGANISM="Grammatophora oceanica, Strain CCMP 410" /LENGTH=100 /DNA_ID=CAMNT_0038677085 /DNA_START=15 /DNA_END=317 /DNA_ORIENTATION=-
MRWSSRFCGGIWKQTGSPSGGEEAGASGKRRSRGAHGRYYYIQEPAKLEQYNSCGAWNLLIQVVGASHHGGRAHHGDSPTSCPSVEIHKSESLDLAGFLI